MYACTCLRATNTVRIGIVVEAASTSDRKNTRGDTGNAAVAHATPQAIIDSPLTNRIHIIETLSSRRRIHPCARRHLLMVQRRCLTLGSMEFATDKVRGLLLLALPLAQGLAHGVHLWVANASNQVVSEGPKIER